MRTQQTRAPAVRDTKQIFIGLALALAAVLMQSTLMAAGPTPVALGETAHFTILAGAATWKAGANMQK